MGNGVLHPPPRVKRPGCDADRSTQSEVKVRNWWSCTSTPLYAFITETATTFTSFYCNLMLGFADAIYSADMRSPSCFHAMAEHQARLYSGTVRFLGAPGDKTQIPLLRYIMDLKIYNYLFKFLLLSSVI